MENRFSIKDLFVFLMLFGIMALIVMGMVQFDRQFDQIKELQSSIKALTNDMNNVRLKLADGVSVNTNGSGTENSNTSTAEVIFPSIIEARAKPDFAEGDWLVENFGTNIGKLTPLISTDVYATWVQVKTMESLVYRDPETLEYKPLLATKWEISPDGKTMIFDLRKNVVFSDGKPMTADDVIFTFKHIMNPDVDAARSRAYMDKLDMTQLEKIDDHRVKFVWKEFVFNAFATVAETLIMPKHFYEGFTPQQYNELPGLLMGTGPYRLATPTEWRPGSGVEVVRNERYWGTKPAFDKIVYHEVKDDVAEETMFRNRELDRYAATPDAFKKLKEDKSITDRAQILEYYSPVSGYTYVGWNERRKEGEGWKETLFADKRVRKAMTMLIDREQLARDLYDGHAQPASGPFGYGSPQTDPGVKPWPYDPAAALKLLAEAGFDSKRSDGIITKGDGTPLEFTLSYGSGNPFTDRIVLFLKDSFARAGVKMNLDAVDWPILLKRLDTRDFDACTLGWSTSIETDCNQIFHSSQMVDQGDNFIGYKSDECDAAINKARSTVNIDERMQAWRAVHRIVHEDQPYTFLLQRQALTFVDARIKNIKKTKMGLNMVLTEMTPLPWYVPKNEQLHKTAN